MPGHLRAACTDFRVLRPGESLAEVPAHPWREAAIPVDDDPQLLARVPLQTGWTAAADLAANGAGRLAVGLRGNHESAERRGFSEGDVRLRRRRLASRGPAGRGSRSGRSS